MISRRIDFLRHIVNRVLIEEKLPPQIVDEIRKQVASAEDRYKFSAFGGDVAKLVDYLKSKDFDLLVSTFKAANGLKVLERILKKAKESYKEFDELSRVLDEKLRELEKILAETSDRKSS